MENRSHAWIAVIFLVVFTAGAGYLFYWLQATNAATRPYRLVSEAGVGGLETGADVTYQGLPAGHVQSVRLDPSDGDRVLVDILVRPGIPVVASTYAELATQGLTGLAHVRLIKPKEGAQPPMESSVEDRAVIPLRPGRLQSLFDSAETVATRMERLSGQLVALTSKRNRRQVLEVVDRLETAVARFERLERRLAPALAQLPALMENAEGALERGEATLEQVQAVAATARRHADDAVAAVEAVDAAGDAGARLAASGRRQLLPEIESALQQFTAAADRMAELAGQLERQPNSVLFGAEPPPPGPGEPGFDPPSEAGGP